MLKENPRLHRRELSKIIDPSRSFQRDQTSLDRDNRLMGYLLREARTDLAHGGAGVAALLASPDQVMAVAFNTIQETGDLTNHAEMVLLHGVSRELQEMSDQERRGLSLYVTLEPCLMCGAALSFAGIKRIVYSALAEDANPEQMIVRDLTLPRVNPHFVRGPFILIPGVRRAEGKALLGEMNKAAGSTALRT
ncbi:MAG: nucleoside deaminase [Candidatus Binatia bacterium]